MTVYAYLFLAATKEHLVSLADQQQVLTSFAAGIGLSLQEVIVEDGAAIQTAFSDRSQGQLMMKSLRSGDVIIVARSAWVLASAQKGVLLLDELKKRRISLYCVDLGEDISMPTERRLVVSEGNARLVRKLLDALSTCEECGHSKAAEIGKRRIRQEGKYSGGPVPFGWQVDQQGYLRRDQKQQQVIDLIRILRGRRCSYRDIAATLNAEHGISLTYEGIRRILHRESGTVVDSSEEAKLQFYQTKLHSKPGSEGS